MIAEALPRTNAAPTDPQRSVPRLGPKVCLAIFLVALLVRLGATAAVGFSTLGFGDAGRYLLAATEIAQHGRYPDRTDPYFFRPPGYPIFLVAATFGQTECIPCAKIANGVVGSLAAVLLAILSARIFRHRRVAIGTGIAAAVHPSFVLLSTDLQSEPLFLIFLLLAGYFLLVAVDAPSASRALLAGAMLGFAALTRPSALTLAPLLAAPLLDRRHSRRVGWRLAGAGLCGFLLLLSPWTLRNALRFHELIPVSDAGGVSLYAGNSGWTHSYYRLRTREEYAGWLERFDRDLRARLARIEAEGRSSPGERSAAFARMAIDESVADPAGTLRLFARKAWHWVRPYPTPWFWPAEVVAGIGVFYAMLYVLAARGLWRSPRRGVAAFCVATLAVSMAVHVALQVVWRYRVPYWDPVLMLYASFAASRMLLRAPTGTA
jgi:4-amino-4-deoxy-L-arabinose transferase-like glycosyltransferase